ncbi:MAG TPA: polysaccharide deacetylase family protein [Kofleriaceae bacterium]|nr:polysaccharide deacetylase family protein [Kofleriaceae bacterium]
MGAGEGWGEDLIHARPRLGGGATGTGMMRRRELTDVAALTGDILWTGWRARALSLMLRCFFMGRREQVATLLARAGGPATILHVRARLRVPVLSILTYHHVCDPGRDYGFDPDTADVTPAQFRRQMELLRQHFTVIGVDQLLAGFDGAELPPNPCLITFDDGYKSNLTVALPILRQLGLKATFFIATSFVEERRIYWWDRIAWIVARARVRALELEYPRRRTILLDHRPTARRALNGVVKDEPGLDVERFLTDLARAAKVEWSSAIERDLADQLIMRWDELRALRDAGMDIESHTRTHRVLQTLAPGALADELAGSRDDLTRQLGRPVRVLAYPVGRAIAPFPHIRSAVTAAGYRLGMTNASGVVPMWRHPDRLDVGRIALDRDLSDEMFLGQLAIPQLGYRARHEAG